MAGPEATLNPLYFPDGAQVLASRNGPIDFHRRDAQRPDVAGIEVVVKPSVGQSGVGERHAESIVCQVLSRIVLKRERGMPRNGILVTLIVMRNQASNGKVSDRRLLLGIDEGNLNMDTYDRVYELAEASCLPSAVEKDGNLSMTGPGAESLETFVRNVVDYKIREDLSWKIAAA
ncbi:exosome non-catalytic core subunit rrp46 [Ascosphaera pollenicola]|nr:exosome non-catalytic core subunit rrp46 [Ascosphaera pollenicola]